MSTLEPRSHTNHTNGSTHDIHRIGVIADTHISHAAKRIPDAALRHFEDVELILHAGDLSTLAALDQLAAYAPVAAVQGNIEEPEVVAALPIKREIVIGGCSIGLVHILGDRKHYARTARQEFPTARVVVFGHSHIPHNEEIGGLLLLNPGSATQRRQQTTCTIALLTVEVGQPRAEIIALA
ncbi:MAG: metallophosphoesterase family protein [Ktedonobacterales bacterium]